MTVANRKAGGYGPTLRDINDLLPTPMTTEANHGDYESEWNRHSPPLGTMVHHPEWGKFAPAIQQWETITNNPAPPPTIPDGRDGQSRLNPQFAEWMMGLPKGWITDCDITRNEQLKACGNGVVPQQATLAITRLLQGLDI
jgi:DNA (cytosine-5)-methyltransferase 1